MSIWNHHDMAKSCKNILGTASFIGAAFVRRRNGSHRTSTQLLHPFPSLNHFENSGWRWYDSRFRPRKWRHTLSPPDLSNIQLQELKENFNGFGASFAPLTSTTEGWNDPWKLGSLFPSIFPFSRSQKFFFFCSNFNLAIARPLACILHYQLLDLHLPDLMGMGNGNLWVLCRFRSWTPSLLDYNVITSHVGNGGLVYGREKGKTNHTLFCTCIEILC